jgi:hypothetical protein
MSCLIPPELDDGQLLAYLTGNAPVAVHQHLEQCPSCRARLETLQGWQFWLAKNLYRTPCPSSLELGEYRLEMLSEEQKASIEQHLSWCPLCRRELQLFGGDERVVQSDPMVNSFQEIANRVRIIIAHLREDLTGLSLEAPTPVLAGMRGQETARSLTYDADDLEISLLIQPNAAQPTQRMLLGWLSDYENDQATEVYLWQGVQQIATTSVDDLGNFAFSALPPGRYNLILHSDTHDIYINDLDL